LKILRSPTKESAKNLLDDSLRNNTTAIVVGKCIVNYHGRASSILPEGERIVIIKPDGTLLVHKKEKREPVNWNPPGCKANVESGGNGLRIVSRRSNPKETLQIKFKELKMAASFELIDEEDLKLRGSEEDLVKSVMKNPELIEEGFKPEEREKQTKSGMVDIYGKDSENRGLALEFKRGKATLSAIDQLKRYVEELEKKLDRPVRGLIVAPKITSSANRLLEKEGLEYVKIEETPSHDLDEVIYDKDQRKIKEFDPE